MTIPRPRADAAFYFAFLVFVVLSVLVALAAPCLSLWLAAPYFWLGLAASLLWLSMVGHTTWDSCKRAGGLHRYLIDIAANMCGRLFAEINTVPPQALELGVYLLGHRFVQRIILLDGIDSVEWSTGQATSMAGHDMNDWHVYLWFDHDDLAKSEEERRSGLRKPEQDLRSVGPYGPKAKTEALGLALVAFLCDAGVDLSAGPTPTCFARRRHEIGG